MLFMLISFILLTTHIASAILLVKPLVGRLANMKMFTLRKIPEKLHLAWKITAAKQGISMEDLAIKILGNGLLESEESEEKESVKRRK